MKKSAKWMLGLVAAFAMVACSAQNDCKFNVKEYAEGKTERLDEVVELTDLFSAQYESIKEQLVDSEGKLLEDIKSIIPKGDKRLSSNPNSNGGKLLRELDLPNFENYMINFDTPGTVIKQDMLEAGKYIGVSTGSYDIEELQLFGYYHAEKEKPHFPRCPRCRQRNRLQFDDQKIWRCPYFHR